MTLWAFAEHGSQQRKRASDYNDVRPDRQHLSEPVAARDQVSLFKFNKSTRGGCHQKSGGHGVGQPCASAILHHSPLHSSPGCSGQRAC
jgi:hypothetical protein